MTLQPHPNPREHEIDTAQRRPDANPRPALLGLTPEEIAAELGPSHPGFRGRQIADWLYRRSARSFSEMTDLPVKLREGLASGFEVGRSDLAVSQEASDKTVKSLLRLKDGETVETVYLPWRDWDSACISTQAGCPAACAFCATGAMGFRRNLTAGEMVDQVLHDIDLSEIHRSGERHRLTHVVFMGMGEPLVNYNPTMKAIRLLNREVGIGMRGITLSTVGIVPGIRRLAAEKLQLTLSVSLHAPDQPLRERIVPVAKTWPLDELMEACRNYAKSTGRRITYEYVLLAGVNDDPGQARQLAALLSDHLCHVNLIPFNPGPTLTEFHTPTVRRLRQFQQTLEDEGCPVTLRTPRGRDIEGACGQLHQVVERSRRGLIGQVLRTRSDDPGPETEIP